MNTFLPYLAFCLKEGRVLSNPKDHYKSKSNALAIIIG